MFTKHISYLFIFLCMSAFISGTSSFSCAKQPQSSIGPAGTVVRIYCEQDALGMFLSGDAAVFGNPYISIEYEEPGWDSLYIIDDFKVVKENYKGKSAYVDVRYHITGTDAGGLKVVKADKYQTLHFKLEMSSNMWKIKSISEFWESKPHIFMSTYKKHMTIVNDQNNRGDD